ncbi:MAG: transposase, partial [Vulcanimicrobiaceae bacterium]
MASLAFSFAVASPKIVAMIVCKRDRWYAQFECQREIVALAAAGAVGLDRGVAVLLATSNGDLIENPRHIDAARLHLERAQRIVAKRKRRGKNRGKAVNALAR